MRPQKHPRRTRQQWQHIIDQLEQSELSAKEFCIEKNLSYQSLIKWKNAFKNLSHSSSFLDITPNSLQGSENQEKQSWDIELQLSPQVILRLRHQP